jgi:GTP-binding protein
MLKAFEYEQATFLKSAAKLSQLPPDEGIEVAFAGLSNVGKSSVLNALTRKQIARTSKTPGRTQCINFFNLSDDRRLVDLPGYGYAKVPVSVKKAWQKLIDVYLRERKSLKGLVLLVDIRHPLKPFEVDLLDWATDVQLSVHVLLTKSDKLSYSARQKTLHQVQSYLSERYGINTISISMFSSKKGDGRENIVEKLNEWLVGL